LRIIDSANPGVGELQRAPARDREHGIAQLDDARPTSLPLARGESAFREVVQAAIRASTRASFSLRMRCSVRLLDSVGMHLSFLAPFPFRPERLSRLVYNSCVGFATKKLFFDIDIF
jgi:hypothetical protein